MKTSRWEEKNEQNCIGSLCGLVTLAQGWEKPSFEHICFFRVCAGAVAQLNRLRVQPMQFQADQMILIFPWRAVGAGPEPAPHAYII